MADLYVELIEPIPIDDIAVLEGREPLNEPTVAMLMESIKRLGLIEPIAVRWVEDPDGQNGRTVLVDGLHRLEACRRIGQRAVNVKQLGADDLTAAMAEVEANRVRNQADPATQVRRTAHSKDLFERIEVAERERQAAEETKREAEVERRRRVEEAKAADPEWSESDSHTFTTEEAFLSGLHPRTIQLRLQWKRDIIDGAWPLIQKHKVLNKVRFFKALAKQPQDQQLAFIEATLANGGKLIDPKGEFKKLTKAWKDASPDARFQFIKEKLGIAVENPDEPGLTVYVRNPTTGAVVEVPLPNTGTNVA